MFDMPIVWVLGGPGCGKGTQCQKIVEKYGYAHYSSGALLRGEVAAGAEKGPELQAIMQAGNLVPTAIVLALLDQAMRRRISEGNAKGFLIDGYPLFVEQGTEFEKTIAPADLIIFFDCKKEVLLERIRGRASAATDGTARSDDTNEETIKTRLDTFDENSKALLSKYPQKTVIVSCEGSVDKIFCEVERAMDCMLEQRAAAASAAACEQE